LNKSHYVLERPTWPSAGAECTLLEDCSVMEASPNSRRRAKSQGYNRAGVACSERCGQCNAGQCVVTVRAAESSNVPMVPVGNAEANVYLGKICVIFTERWIVRK